MKFQIIVLSESGERISAYNLQKSENDEPKNLNDFIIEALQISEDKRKLPLKMQCPNGLEVYPSIKMKFENYGSAITGDKLESMMIHWK